MTTRNTVKLDIPAAPAPARPQRRSGLAAWLAQERVFRLIPFVMVEGMFLLLLAIPFVLTIYISLLKWRANRPFEQAVFEGLDNYLRVLQEPEFWGALGRTFYFAGVAVALELLLGFLLAMLVYKECRGQKVYITIFLLPMMVVPVVVGYNFSMIYVDSGPLNQLLAPFLTPFGIDPRIRWLSHPVAAQWAVILADVWQWTSLTFLIFLSGFSALPQELINAARVMVKLFDQAVLLTFGGPGNATQTIAFYLWRQVWQFNKFSFGAAASVLLLLLFAGLIYFGIYLLVRQRALVYYEETH
jgi:multiple sugar transport system permease protein